MVLGELSISDFNDDAAEAALWTSQVLTQESRAFLEPLQPCGRGGGSRPLPRERARPGLGVRAHRRGSTRNVRALGRPAHPRRTQSRRAGAVRQRRPDHRRRRPRVGSVELEGRWLSTRAPVGQPRDGDPRAAWLLLDFDRRFAAFRRTPYAIEAAQAEMRERVSLSPSQPGSNVASNRSKRSGRGLWRGRRSRRLAGCGSNPTPRAARRRSCRPASRHRLRPGVTRSHRLSRRRMPVEALEPRAAAAARDARLDQHGTRARRLPGTPRV